MSVFNFGYIIYDARIGVIKSIYAAILSIRPALRGHWLCFAAHTKNIFSLFEFFCGEKSKNLYQTAR